MVNRILLLLVLFGGVFFSCKRNVKTVSDGKKTVQQNDSLEYNSTTPALATDENSFPELGPDFSPDGSRIAYYSYINKEWTASRIYIINTDGTNRRELTTNDSIGFHTEPIWSFDGNRIGYTSFLEEGARMMSINSDGTNLRELISISEKGFHMFSSWDRTGEGYYFFYWDDGEDFRPDAYYALNGEITRLTEDGITNRPQLADDGTLYISKIVDLENNKYAQHILDLNTLKVTAVPELEGWFIRGNQVLKQQESEEGTSFILEDLSGNDLKELGAVSHKGLMFAKIAPNRDYVAYNTSFEDGAAIYLLNLDTQELTKLTTNE